MAEVCAHLGGTVTRLCLAACGMAVPGARAVAQLLRGHRALRYLDLGLLKATSALAEVPNRIADAAWSRSEVSRGSEEGAMLLAEALESSTLQLGLCGYPLPPGAAQECPRAGAQHDSPSWLESHPDLTCQEYLPSEAWHLAKPIVFVGHDKPQAGARAIGHRLQ